MAIYFSGPCIDFLHCDERKGWNDVDEDFEVNLEFPLLSNPNGAKFFDPPNLFSGVFGLSDSTRESSKTSTLDSACGSLYLCHVFVCLPFDHMYNIVIDLKSQHITEIDMRRACDVFANYFLAILSSSP